MRPTLRTLQNASKAMQRPTSTSFIGLGRMGYQMALNLFSKQHLNANEASFIVCDAVPEAAQAFCSEFTSQYPEAQISIASTPAEAAFASSKIITMLPSSPQVKSVYNESIIPTLRKLHATSSADTLCIDSTTLDVSVAREVAASVVDTGAQMIDAPVSGGVSGAKAGTLSFLVGGTEECFIQAQPVLSLMGGRIIHCGPSGAGLAAKICNNLVLGVEQIVVAEAMLLGQSLGLNPAVLASVINSSTGGCWSSSTNNPVPSALPDKSPPCERDYEGGFATVLMLKDMGLASHVAEQYKSPLPLGEAAKEIYEEVAKTPDLANKDFSAVYRFLQQQSG
ncbi:3-hydroxyisobutyrate dehydrogenase [Crepidotus variabilis]|uniref:3-hydroxyisobutyrate dehydrogenase n=1 Tax=Crepidotus variabilis TaxID=179855 RepID=A0A9P6EPK2_9AGAR|nr:3-hydroxyisobutyrate dehydrogenase [Crepidotus variabilis]